MAIFLVVTPFLKGSCLQFCYPIRIELFDNEIFELSWVQSSKKFLNYWQVIFSFFLKLKDMTFGSA